MVKQYYMPPNQDGADASAEDIGVRLLQALGEDVERGGLKETPQRWLAYMRASTSGMGQDPKALLKVFEDGGDNVDQMVTVANIPFYSMCVIGSTFVETPRGRIPISYLKNGDWVYTINPDTLELGLVRCQNPRITRRNAKLVRVYADNDTLICTPDHKILTYQHGWVEAQALQAGDRIVSLYRSPTFADSGVYVNLLARKYARRNSPDHMFILGKEEPVPEHRFVAHTALNDKHDFTRRQIAHHLNGITWDNDPDNLQSLTVRQHNLQHQRTQKLASHEGRKAAAAKASGRLDVREKRAASVKAYWDNIKQNPNAYKDRCAATQQGIATSQRNHVVFGVEFLTQREDVWCMTVPKTHSFFANGMAVHNCEHHLAPFFGVAHIAYIPGKVWVERDGQLTSGAVPNGPAKKVSRILGLSKIPRLLDLFAKRLQVQERITNQVADVLHTELGAIGVGVVLRARHLCMEMRGVQKAGSITYTSALRGAIKDLPEARSEFMQFVNMADRQTGSL